MHLKNWLAQHPHTRLQAYWHRLCGFMAHGGCGGPALEALLYTCGTAIPLPTTPKLQQQQPSSLQIHHTFCLAHHGSQTTLLSSRLPSNILKCNIHCGWSAEVQQGFVKSETASKSDSQAQVKAHAVSQELLYRSPSTSLVPPHSVLKASFAS